MAASDPDKLRTTLLRASWMSILVGIAIELALLALAAGSGSWTSWKPVVADLVQKVSWSTIVCVGLAIGTGAARSRAATMGGLGLLAAPLAFAAARSLHKGAASALSLSGPGGAFPYGIALLKALEYACLGAALGRLSTRAARARAYVSVGLACALTFGTSIVVVMAAGAAKPLETSDVVARSVNELLFPVGCSLVLYAAGSLGKRLSPEPAPS